jgi:hypothetical protein
MEFLDTIIKYTFLPFCMRLALKLGESTHKYKQNKFFAIIGCGYHKTQNSMLSWNPLKKMQKSYKKLKADTFSHSNKSKKLNIFL